MVQNTSFLHHFSLKRLAMIFYVSDHFFAASQGNIDNAFSARELRCLCTSNSDRAWNSNFPKKTRLSKEMKPDGLICIGIFLPPSISGIRLSSLLGVRTEGWNKRSTYQARDALFPSAILSTWHWALRILNTACARVAMSQAHSLVDIELRIGENSSESVFFCRLLTILKSLWKVVSNGCLFLEVTDSEALSMGWKEADLDTLKDHHLCSLSSIRLSKQYSPMLLIDLLFLLTWLVSLPREAV